MSKIITVHCGDITQLTVDVIVNAANAQLAGGGGVDGAIHRAAGPELYVACRKIGGCPTGEVRVTPAFNLSAKAIFHAVGPVWHGGKQGEAELLASCYRQCMNLLEQKSFASIAFPAISCGVYGYPIEQAARIAVKEVRQAAEKIDCLSKVIFCCFDELTANYYRQALAETPR